MIYVVDKRQELHFVQVFRCARKTKIVNEKTDLQFVGFGTMNGKDGKPFKTRDGGVMRLENLIREINEEMYKKLLITAPYQKKRRERQHRSLDFLQLSTEISPTRHQKIMCLM